MNRFVKIKAEQIARHVVNNVPLTKIALAMGMSYDGLLRITKTIEYQEIEADIRAQHLGQLDAKLAARVDLRQKAADEMEDAVPEAMQVLLDGLRKKRDLKSALEVLDRDPKRQFAKGASAAKPAETVRPSIDSKVLAQAVKDADITHSILNKQVQSTKPAEA